MLEPGLVLELATQKTSDIGKQSMKLFVLPIELRDSYFDSYQHSSTSQQPSAAYASRHSHADLRLLLQPRL